MKLCHRAPQAVLHMSTPVFVGELPVTMGITVVTTRRRVHLMLEPGASLRYLVHSELLCLLAEADESRRFSV